MNNEIERKFYVKEMPDLTGVEPLHYERYFLERGNGKEVRISKVNNKYVYEEKSEVSDLERTREKREITEGEFNELKEKASSVLIRESYNLQENPNISIKIYHGKYEGLIRAEVEFDSEEEARSFQPLPWMGEEMTGLPIARDSSLLDLSEEELRKYLSF